MRRILSITAVIASSLAGISSHAGTITSADQVAKFGAPVTVDFSEFKGKSKMVFGSPEIGQPYARLGLVLPSQMIDDNAALTPTSNVAVKSTSFSTADNSNYQSVAFTAPQKVVGFNVRSAKAKSVIVTALDSSGNVLGQSILDGAKDTKFVGFAFENALITVVRIVATHDTIGDAMESPTFITGITFITRESAETGTGDLVTGGSVSDYGLAQAVGNPGAGLSDTAMASASSTAFTGSGTGNAGNFTGGRNPGNRNANLPATPIVPTPSPIPEPTAVLAAGGLGGMFVLRRRRRI